MSQKPLKWLFSGIVCSRCLARTVRSAATNDLYRSSFHTKRKLNGSLVPPFFAQKNFPIAQQGFTQDYFSANGSIDRGWLQNSFLAVVRTNTGESAAREEMMRRGATADMESADAKGLDEALGRDGMSRSLQQSAPEPTVRAVSDSAEQEVLPHRRRKRRKELEEESVPNDNSESLPLDASSQLTTRASSLPTTATLRRRFATYLALTKPRLSFLILLTTTSAYSLYPLPEILSSTDLAPATTLSTSTLTLLFLTTGTFLSCAAANTLNMLFEPRYDALMTRTRNRPLVRKLLTPRAALLFAIACAGSGLSLLYFGTNPTVAGLSALNIFLYAGVYTPMKRISAANTWVGAIVGGIPPLMGWCAAAGQAATTEHHAASDLLFGEGSVGGWLLAALLFAWQFPHFMSLSHTIREDYKAAGHKMLAWTNPARNARVALRYSIAMFPICAGLYAVGVVNEGFLVVSTACNSWMLREAVRFWRKQGAAGSARGLFWASVWQLPLVLVGALVCKTGVWDGVFGEKEKQVIAEEGETLGMEEKRHTFQDAFMGFKRPS